MNTSESIASHRILDANLNRAFEAFRTLEDVARFRDHAFHQRAYKSLRHQLQVSTSNWNRELLLACRNAADDVGRESKTASESQRDSGLRDVVAAASQRLQQALRSLEEIAKFAYPQSAPPIEAIRYQVYDLNASLQLGLERDLAFLKQARLYVLADCRIDEKTFASKIQSISEQGVDLIQIRDKESDASELLRYTEIAQSTVDPSRTRIVTNDRADVALLANTYGLHVGQTDLTLSQARRIVSPTTVIGLSTHSREQVQQAVRLGADYIGCGPTFPSQTKSFEAFAGLAFLREVAEELAETQLPAFAIGGIDIDNLADVLATGVHRVVIGSAIWRSSNSVQQTQTIRRIIDNVP